VSRARAVALASLAFALQLLLASNAFAGLPPAARVVLAFAVLVLAPGLAWLAVIRATPPGGRGLSIGWALGLGVAWMGLLVLATRALHLPFTVLVRASAVIDLAPWALLVARPGSASRPPGLRLRAPALAAVLLAATVAVGHVARTPAPVSYYTDAPDHLGTVRRMMAEGDAFPNDAFFRDAGAAGADPRKGLWHPIVALIALLAHAQPLVAWGTLAALLAGLFVLNAAALGALVSGTAGAVVAAWGLLLTYGGSMTAQYLGEAVFATKLADQLALACAAALLLDLETPAVSTRGAALALGLAAVFVHVFAALQFAIVFGALLVGLLVRDRGASPVVRRALGTALAIGITCSPYLAWRAHGAYAPRNPIHLEPQGLLVLGGRLRIVSIGVLWDWLGRAWVLVPLSWWAWARNAARPAVLYLLTTTLAVATIQFCPPVVALLEPRLGYLLMRMIWLVPLSAVLAFAIPALVRALRERRGPGRFGAAAGLAALALVLSPELGDAVIALRHPGFADQRDARVSVMRWADALAWMDAHLPQGSVVLSDPATSYSIPMGTRDWVETLVDQHSSPDDSLALDRILDARDALDPCAPYARLGQVVRRWGVTAIALNDRFVEIPHLDYWAPNPTWFVAARARLDAAPAAFKRVYDTGDFAVWRINLAALDTLEGGGRPRPDVRPYDPGRDGPGRAGNPGMPSVIAVRLSENSARPGDTVGVAIDWRAPAPLPAGSYLVTVRFDRTGSVTPGVPAWCAKPARKIVEKLRHERYRFRADHLPVDGDYGVDLWRSDEVVHDTTGVEVPPDVASGDYVVQVAMLRQPHYPNLRLSDYFFDHDYYSGVPVGTLHIGRDPR